MSPTLLLAFLLAAPAPPGLYYEQVTESTLGKTSRGQPVRTRVYALGRRMRLESAEGPNGPAMVLRLDEARAFRLDPASLTARPIDLERLREQSQLDLSAAGEALGAAGEGSVRTTSLPGTKTLAGRRCRGFRIAAPEASLDLYVADLGPGVGIDTFADFLEWSGASLALGPVLDEMRRLPGFPLETRTRARVHGQDLTVVTTVTKIELGPLGPGLFDIPAGYRILDAPAEEEP